MPLWAGARRPRQRGHGGRAREAPRGHRPQDPSPREARRGPGLGPPRAQPRLFDPRRGGIRFGKAVAHATRRFPEAPNEGGPLSDTVSTSLFERAEKVIPGGVNSPVRAFRAVGGHPVFIARAAGSKVFGADGVAYIDYVGSWGPAFLGHAHPAVVAAVQRAAEGGLSFGAPTELEVRFAEKVKSLYPSMQKMRCVSSGTEATMSAIRVARGFTGRDLIVKFEGAYHGHADHLLAKAGSGVATLALPECAGVPAAVTADTLTLPYNDIGQIEAVFAARGD